MVGTNNNMKIKKGEAMESYKLGWRFLKQYKLRMLLLIICMVFVQFLTMLSPYIISKIIDDHIIGVTYPWVEVSESDHKTVEFDNAYYKQARYLDSDDQVLGDVTVIIDGSDFYVIEGKVNVQDGQQRTFNDDYSQITIDGETYECQKLSNEQVRLLYNPLIPSLMILLVLLLVTLLAKSLFGFAQRMLSANITADVTRDIRIEAIEKIQYVPLSFIEEEPAGKTTNRITADSMGISDLYMTTLNVIFSSFVGIFFAYLFMFMLDPKLAALCLILIPIIFLWIKYFARVINVIATKTQESNSLMIASINEIINGLNILRVFEREKETLDEFADLNDRYLDESMSEVKMHLKFGWNGINMFQATVGALVIFFFGYMNLNGHMLVQAGVVYAFYNYINMLIAPVGQLFHSFGAIENSKVKVNRICLLLNQEVEDQTINQDVKYNGKITFKDVNFGYTKDKLVLKNINLEILPKQKIALVGHTGSGKSTMMNLLLRFNDITGENGQILVDDLDINTMTKREYRQDIGIILQEPVLFSGTIYDNICYAKTVRKEEAIEMLKAVGGQRILEKFDEGIDAPLTRRGGNLSLGEKQLIAFARILVSNPSIIVMDEATANIDTETEEMINKGIEAVAKNRTMIVIAHRLSTIVDSDQIFVLSQGEVIEHGNHAHLLKENGYYANMYRSQVSN